MVMTMVFKKCPPTHSSRCRDDDVVMAVEQPSSKILHYQRPGYKKKLEIPADVLLENSDVQIRYDLLDCQISICSPQVPQLFTDNFDYQTRDDFVKGILINEEIMGNSIYLNVVRDEYAARISSLQMYDSVSRDVINRWTYPFVPDNMNPRDENRMSYGRANVYKSKNVTLARGCILEANVMVGSGTSIGSKTVISQSVIGKNCKIGENVRIEGCYIWDHVVIEDNCKLETALICDHTVLHAYTTVGKGCVLTQGVVVGPAITLTKHTVLQSVPQEEESFDDISLRDTSKTKTVAPQVCDSEYGKHAKAYKYERPADSDDDEEEDLVQELWGLGIHSDDSGSDASSINLEEDDSDEEEDVDERTAFYLELIDTLRRSREMNISTENLIVEINSLKHPYNIHITDLQGQVVKAVIELPMLDDADLSGGPLLGSIKKHMTKHLRLLKNYIKGKDAQLNCINALEEFALSETKMCSIISKVLHMLYEQFDLLSEEVIISWYKSLPLGSDEHAVIVKQVGPLVQWLEEAEEESSDED